MSDLLDRTIEAHSGLERWRGVRAMMSHLTARGRSSAPDRERHFALAISDVNENVRAGIVIGFEEMEGADSLQQ